MRVAAEARSNFVSLRKGDRSRAPSRVRISRRGLVHLAGSGTTKTTWSTIMW